MYFVESHQDMYNYRVMEVIDDLPVPNDMDRYLSSLKRIMHFIDGHKYYVDVDLCFSIYLINGKTIEFINGFLIGLYAKQNLF